MLIKANTMTVVGMIPKTIIAEVNIANRGMPRFDIVGLPNKAVDESRYRVKTALQNSGIDFPNKRITVNLAPADIPKMGSAFDFPISVGIMCGVLEVAVPKDALFIGELSLDGSVCHTKGVLLAVLHARELGMSRIFIPHENVGEVSGIDGIQILPVESIRQFMNYLLETCDISLVPPPEFKKAPLKATSRVDMCHIVGQSYVKRALEICAAGSHNILMSGPPGSGKTMLARSFCTILPLLSFEESIEVTKIYSILGKIPPNTPLISERPFRTPHHTVSYSGMVGGGNFPHPREVSLAHRGVLFLDELPEYRRDVLESLRQPLEDGYVTVTRSSGSFEFPSRFILVATSNPCPCGYYGVEEKSCVCTPHQISVYRNKISGPILDRIDMFVVVNSVSVEKMRNYAGSHSKEESSVEIRSRVENARALQAERFSEESYTTNSEIESCDIKKFCEMHRGASIMLEKSFTKFGLSTRAFFKIIKIARTIADLESVSVITEEHVAEALQYRARITVS